MPKLKTHKGVKARIKVTGTGKLMYRRGGRRHLMTGKPSKRTRKMRQRQELSPAHEVSIRALLPYE